MMTKERLSGIIIKMIRKVCRKGAFLLKKTVITDVGIAEKFSE